MFLEVPGNSSINHQVYSISVQLQARVTVDRGPYQSLHNPLLKPPLAPNNKAKSPVFLGNILDHRSTNEGDPALLWKTKKGSFKLPGHVCLLLGHHKDVLHSLILPRLIRDKTG